MHPSLPPSLIQRLCIHDAQSQLTPIAGGLIHHTYRLQVGNEQTLLQSINTEIFLNPIGLIQNHLALYEHFLSAGSPFPRPLAKPLPFPDGSWLHVDECNQTWRRTEFIPNSYTHPTVEDPKQAFTLAEFFARFTRHAASVNQSAWHIPLSRFHDLSFRYEQFEQASKEDPFGRKNSQPALIQELESRLHYVKTFLQIDRHPAFPLRMMHHDAKRSNVLMDQQEGTWLCPIDLDTVMPGYFFSDLGDMIRSLCNGSEKEDSTAEQVHFRSDLFESLLTGYRAGLTGILSPPEDQLLPISGVWMTYMQCLRFMSDYLNGDLYYRIEHPQQNLDRVNNQLELLRQMENHLQRNGRASLLSGEIG
ncbi:MAG: aminoglycoside phosphotransferase family protein [Bacteroidetes bacterium]|nr:aminoglycoside phosphotransferase family protein [Bacteroidota bacterium]